MAKTNNKKRTVTIVGYVDPVDEDDHEAGILISTEDDEVYLVDLNKQGRKLVDLIGEKVKAQGTVIEEDGENRISVNKFEVIDFEESDEEDAYYKDYDDIEQYDY